MDYSETPAYLAAVDRIEAADQTHTDTFIDQAGTNWEWPAGADFRDVLTLLADEMTPDEIAATLAYYDRQTAEAPSTETFVPAAPYHFVEIDLDAGSLSISSDHLI